MRQIYKTIIHLETYNHIWLCVIEMYNEHVQNHRDLSQKLLYIYIYISRSSIMIALVIHMYNRNRKITDTYFESQYTSEYHWQCIHMVLIYLDVYSKQLQKH